MSVVYSGYLNMKFPQKFIYWVLHTLLLHIGNHKCSLCLYVLTKDVVQNTCGTEIIVFPLFYDRYCILFLIKFCNAWSQCLNILQFTHWKITDTN